jgi:hypothetical protein
MLYQEKNHLLIITYFPRDARRFYLVAVHYEVTREDQKISAPDRTAPWTLSAST